MEIKINKEIRDYTESMFFGLSMRQCICSALAIILSVGLYFILKDYLYKEIISWICIIAVIPSGLLGFFKFQGMTFEEFLITFIKNEILTPKELTCEMTLIYMQILGGKEKC